MKAFCLLILLFCEISLLAQIVPDKRTDQQNRLSGIIPVGEAVKDLSQFVSALQEIHPDLYWQCSRSAFDHLYDSIRSTLPETGLTPVQLYQAIQPLTTVLGDGHTQLYFPKEQLQATDALVFPLLLDVNTRDSSLQVRKTFSHSQVVIPEGAKITMINGLDYRVLVSDMMKYCSGERSFFRLSKVNRDFTHFLYMLFPDHERYSVTYSKGEDLITTEVKAIPYSRYVALVEKTTLKKDPYQYELLGGRVALMTFHAFSDLDRFKTFVQGMFQELKEKKVETLIIDLRLNGGGNSDIGDELFQYISPCPFHQFSKQVIRYSDLQKKLAKENFGNDYAGFENGIQEIRTDTLIPLRPNPLRFHGKLYLLISHTTFSSAAAFSWTFHQFGMGKIIGEESGGMNVCFGDIVIYRLPYSNIAGTISFARIYEYGAGEENIHGTMPDVFVLPEEALDYVLKETGLH